MIKDKGQESRKSARHDTEVKLFFDFLYDIETKVKFELIDQKKGEILSKKYPAVSRNISTEGLCFSSSKKVEQGALLHLEVYLPSAKEPIDMKGEVKWCKLVSSDSDDVSTEEGISGTFDTGVKLTLVDGELVHKSIYHDKVYSVDWSIVLESIFDNYKTLMAGKYKK